MAEQETRNRVPGGRPTVMRFTYKVREISKDDNDVEDIVDLGEAEIMEAMSFKKLRAKLDHKKKYFVEYKNKKNNFVSTITTGKEPK